MTGMQTDKKQAKIDLDLVQDSLEHALTYPSQRGKVMPPDEFHAAHEELQQALNAIKRLRRVYLGTRIKATGNKGSSKNGTASRE